MASSQRQNITAIIKDKRGRVLALGKNTYTKTHPLMLKLGKRHNLTEKIYLHAEVDAIIKCSEIERAYSIEVYRINTPGKHMPSKPCPICLSAIKATPIKYIQYTDNTNQPAILKVT
jgi:tRNA(Arg) A34 adenosine deaminase TadA